MTEVLLAVDAATAALTADDRILRDALRRRGRACRPFVWGTPPPPGCRMIIRSTWDYVDRPEQFMRWLGDLDAAGADVHNSTALLRWNMHKAYLVELADRDVPVVPTVLVERETGWSLDEVLDENGWTDAVIKPAIGASARLTVHVGRLGRVEAAAHFERLLRADDALVQTFLPSVVGDGELSIVAIGGEVTHAVVKRPAAGDWRVQREFGGTTALVAVTQEHVDTAARVLGALDEQPTYARIDLLRERDELLLVELELIEPELFFGLAPESATRLVDVVAR